MHDDGVVVNSIISLSVWSSNIRSTKNYFVHIKLKLIYHFVICFSMDDNHIFICMRTVLARVLTIYNNEADTSSPAGCLCMTSE